MEKSVSIFYSYAHEDERLRKKLETHLALLQQQGLITTWHDRKISAGTEWMNEVSTYLNTAQIILLLVSPPFLASKYCYGNEMMRALERHKEGTTRVIPIILRSVDWEGAPFSQLQALPTDAKPITGHGWRNIDEAFTDVVHGIRKAVEELRSKSSNVHRVAQPGATSDKKLTEMIETKEDNKVPPISDVNLNELPIPSVSHMFGREKEKALLHEYLDNKEVSIVSIVGFGGIGKSSLVDDFISDIAPDYGGVRRVFGWHFYSQESQDAVVANSALFFERALQFYGFKETVPIHENEKAQELLKLLHAQKTILVLDGIEPLQHSPNVNQGYLSDKAMQILLTYLARDGLHSGGLVLLTSRQPVVEISRLKHTKTIELSPLDEDAGVELLTFLGIRGSRDELSSTVRDYKGHPLSLVLLGKILKTDYKGDILHRFNVDLLDVEIEDHIINILEYYSKEWAEQDPERIFMYLLSLFRRPMRERELEELAAKSHIAESLRTMKQTKLNRMLTHLSSSGLLIYEDDYYDTHALIRKYFATQFRKDQRENFIQAQRILFDYFKNVPQEELPSDMDSLEPLYRAIYHGCMADEYCAAFNIFWDRISRQTTFFSQKQLGAHSSDLFAISQFFPDGWDNPIQEDLTHEQQALLLALASFLLTALGRFDEATRPRQREIALLEKSGDWRAACADLRNLVQILIPLGKLEQALEVSERAIVAAQQISDQEHLDSYYAELDSNFLYTSALVRKATVLHRMKRIEESSNAFGEAERRQGSYLNRINGYYYELFLLDTASDEAALREVVRRCEHNLSLAKERKNLGDIGHHHLILGGTYAALNENQLALTHLDEAVDMLQKANRLDRIPYALIQRANFLRVLWLRDHDNLYQEQYEADISEAEHLIVLSNMSLYLIDLHLLVAHILIDNNRLEEARKLIQMSISPNIQNTDYVLRSKDLDLLKHRLSSLEGKGQ